MAAKRPSRGLKGRLWRVKAERSEDCDLFFFGKSDQENEKQEGKEYKVKCRPRSGRRAARRAASGE